MTPLTSVPRLSFLHKTLPTLTWFLTLRQQQGCGFYKTCLVGTWRPSRDMWLSSHLELKTPQSFPRSGCLEPRLALTSLTASQKDLYLYNSESMRMGTLL